VWDGTLEALMLKTVAIMDKKKSVLLVEDDETLLRALQDTLVSEGLTVYIAKSAEEGITLAQKHHPDLIMTDVILPVMDGVAMITKLRKDSMFKETPVIMLTNRDDADTVGASLTEGVYDFLVKHEWKLEDIAKRVKQRLGGGPNRI
jgi:DNA-binding response OmpR family regulator